MFRPLFHTPDAISGLDQKPVKTKSRYRKYLVILLGIMLVFRLALAFGTELGNDEAYYWLYSQYLQWNYFDHTPMVALTIRVFTANGLLQHFEGFVRLGSVAGGLIASYFLFRAVALLHSER